MIATSDRATGDANGAAGNEIDISVLDGGTMDGLLDRSDAARYADMLRLRPSQILPRMIWWEWAWYVTGVVAGALLLEHLHAWLLGTFVRVPVLTWVPWLLSVPIIAGLFVLWGMYVLPARAARRAAPGEGWLLAALWVIALGGEALICRI